MCQEETELNNVNILILEWIQFYIWKTVQVNEWRSCLQDRNLHVHRFLCWTYDKNEVNIGKVHAWIRWEEL